MEENKQQVPKISDIVNVGGMIGAIFIAALKTYGSFQRNRSSQVSKQNIGAQVITIPVICSSDVSSSTRDAYLKAMQTLIAFHIRAAVVSDERGSLSSTAAQIFKSLPFLTNYDKVALKQATNTLTDTLNMLDEIKNIGNSMGNQKAVDVFLESVLDSIDTEYQIAMEAEAGFKDAPGFGPQYIDIPIYKGTLDKRQNERVIQIGVRCFAKVVDPSELMSFLIQKNASLANTKVQEASYNVIKNKLSTLMTGLKSIFARSKEKKAIEYSTKLAEQFSKVQNIKKPFVAILTSIDVYDRLKEEFNLDLTSATVAKKIYQSLPVFSISVYNSKMDNITASFNKDAVFETTDFGNLINQTEKINKELNSLLRQKSYF